VTSRQKVLATTPFVADARSVSENDVRVAYNALPRVIGDADDLAIAAWAFRLQIADSTVIAAMLPSDACLAEVLRPSGTALPTPSRQQVEYYIRAADVGYYEHIAENAAEARWMLILDMLASVAPDALARMAVLPSAGITFIRWAVSYEPSTARTRDAVIGALFATKLPNAAHAAGVVLARSLHAYVQPFRRMGGLRFFHGLGSDARLLAVLVSKMLQMTIHQPYIRFNPRWRRVWNLLNAYGRRLLNKREAVEAFVALDGRDEAALAAFVLRNASKDGVSAAQSRARSVLNALFGAQLNPQEEHRPISALIFRSVVEIAAVLPLTPQLISRFVSGIQADRLTWLCVPIAYEYERQRMFVLMAVAYLIEACPSDRISVTVESILDGLRTLPPGRYAAIPAEIVQEFPRLRRLDLPWS
jgi:hypothetical protein